MSEDKPNFDGMALDKTSVAQKLLNIDSKLRSNLFPWKGQFSPQLIEVLLRTYCPRNGLALDPFVGSGTVLYEAGTLGTPGVGAELNPAACAMARIYCLMNLTAAGRTSVANRLERILQERIPDQQPGLFSTNGNSTDRDVKDSLIEIHGQLSDDEARWLFEALVVLVDFYEEVSDQKVFDVWAKLKARVLGLPGSDSPIRLLNCDARRLPFGDGEVDFVITSPPYINVFNYHQQYRRSVEALGWDLLTVARSEIGSNRKHRGNRFLTVIQYCLDMTDVLRELQRVCKEHSRVVVVVGRESNVRKTRFFNGEIMAALACRCLGFPFVSRQERVFMNRFGEQIYEDILHFHVEKGGSAFAAEPRSIAVEILQEARKRTPDESLGDLEDALGLAGEVHSSPIYRKHARRPMMSSQPSRVPDIT